MNHIVLLPTMDHQAADLHLLITDLQVMGLHLQNMGLQAMDLQIMDLRAMAHHRTKDLTEASRLTMAHQMRLYTSLLARASTPPSCLN